MKTLAILTLAVGILCLIGTIVLVIRLKIFGKSIFECKLHLIVMSLQSLNKVAMRFGSGYQSEDSPIQD